MIGSQAGCPDANRITEIVSMMADPRKLYFCGQLGAGNAAKISNNYMTGTITVAIAEATAIGVRSGVDPETLHKIISNSSGSSWVGEYMNPVPGVVATAPSSRGYQAGF